MIARRSPIRVLHVVGGMNPGGVETWLMHVLRNIDRRRFRMDFLVHTENRCVYDDEIRSLGARILPCPCPSHPWTYARNIRRVLAEGGPYDVVHSHVHHFSGFVLKLAAGCGVPARIAHSHNDTSHGDAHASLARQVYLHLGAAWIRRHATSRLACSAPAARCLFGANWGEPPAARIVRCGIDLEPFKEATDRERVRAELGIPRGAFVVGHVGQFREAKNHAFLVDVAAEVMGRLPGAALLLVGAGELEDAVRDKVRRSGCADHVFFAGNRSDVPRILRGAMDAFLFPSFFEGLPLAAIEAQAAGLPCFLSDRITTETHVVKPLVTNLSLTDTPSAWAERILDVSSAGPAIRREEALALVERSPFNIQASIASLQAFYEGGWSKSGRSAKE